jgi:hypothetical protein
MKLRVSVAAVPGDYWRGCAVAGVSFVNVTRYARSVDTSVFVDKKVYLLGGFG